MYNDSLAIIKPIENSPSARAGIKAGDRIYMENETFGRKLSSDSLFNLKGEQGSVVELTIYRKSERKKLKVKN
jgi:carboxyl-terminal processing protease